MIDLPVTTAAPTPDPSEVQFYALDDGNGIARAFAMTGDGTVHALTPEAPLPPPSQRLTTVGFHGPAVRRPLVWSEPVAAELSQPVDRDVPAGASIAVAWQQATPATVGWAEVALLAEVAPEGAGFGNPCLTIVGHVDAAAAMLSASDVTAGLVFTTTRAIPRGTSLWFALVAWNNAGTPPAVYGSPYADPIASGAVVRLNAALGWRPSQRDPGEVLTWDAQAGTLPIAAAVRIP
jgi:hypothetical protein